jgi:Leucine-rich repeat (LRR) protein
MLLDNNLLTKIPIGTTKSLTSTKTKNPNRKATTKSPIIRQQQSITKTAALNKFSLLTYLDLSNNEITTIKSGDLKLSAPLQYIDLSSNQINTIAPGSFPGESIICFNNYIVQKKFE